jgi:ribosomal protein L29
MFKTEELRKLDVKKLREELKKAEKDLFKARFEAKAGTSKASHLIANYRKYVAQIKTVLHEANHEANAETNTEEATTK